MVEIQAIGMMSGTSLDGLDLAACTFFENDTVWSFRIDAVETIHYDTSFKSKLASAHQLSGIDLALLNNEFGRFLGEQSLVFIEKHQLTPSLICSHGHTVFHQPEKKITLQIGSLHEIHASTNVKTIGDFRSLDVALGGQGAPLVPIGDQYLFSEFEYCVNLGGIANVSYDLCGERLAFDICPVNLVLNQIVGQVGLEFDDGGKIASTGKLNQDLLLKLNALDYYKKSLPKSLGREWVESLVIPLIENFNIALEDKLCTFCHHIAHQISLVIFEGQALFTGGGAYNTFLMELIDQKLKGTTLIIPSKEIVEFKEALIFAFLGVLKEKGEINILKSVTGGKLNSVAGVSIG